MHNQVFHCSLRQSLLEYVMKFRELAKDSISSQSIHAEFQVKVSCNWTYIDHGNLYFSF